MTRLVLASASPRRQELLGLLRLPFVVNPVDIAELPRGNERPPALVMRLSRAKAWAALALMADELTSDPDTVILGCDTVVAFGDEILGKPASDADAWEMLHRLKGRWHLVYTGLALVCAATGCALTDVAATRVRMRDYSDAEVSAYITSGDPFDKAGAYGIQHSGFHPVAEIQGSYTNVVGLPLCHLARCLRRCGIEPRADVPVVCQAHTGHTCRLSDGILAGQPISSRL